MTTMTDAEILVLLDKAVACMPTREDRKDMRQARAHIAEALMDAERYRWIVESNEIPDSVNYAVFMSDKRAADAAIDAAMRGEG
jgi:hypothetical protein